MAYPPERTAAETLAYWNREFNVDFKKLFGSLVRLATAATFDKWDQVAIAAADAVVCFRSDLPREGLFWLLVQRGLHAATHGLIAQSPISHVLTGSPDADRIAAKFDDLFAEQPAEIPSGFLEHPADLDLLHKFRTVFEEWLVANQVEAPAAKGLADLLPTAFIYEIRREWDRRAADYKPLKEFIEGPFARAEGVERAWLAHAARLEREAREPVFVETFGLRDLYLPTRAWQERDGPVDKNEDPRFHTPPARREVLDLDRFLAAWAETGVNDDRSLQFVSGDPGSGKSSFTRIFAADQAARGRRVLRVPLHEYRAERSLKEAILDFAPWEDRQLGSPLAPPGETRDLLLIFDGLDELAQADKAGADLALTFVREVRDWVRDTRREGRPVQVLITGRTPVVQTVAAELRDLCRPLELLPLAPPWPEETGKTEWIDPHSLLTDRRAEWWSRYAALTRAPEAEMPAPLREGSLAGFTQQPLLCILAARWWRSQKDRTKEGSEGLKDEDPVNRNQVLVLLLNDVFRGSHNRLRRNPAVAKLTFLGYLRLLEEIALVVAQHGGRLAPLEAVRKHLEGTPEIVELLGGNVQAALEEGLFRLLAAFYFRRGEAARKEAGSLEFTHKQFAEYLLALRLVRAIEDTHENLTRRRSPQPVPQALAEWTALFGRITLTLAVQTFLNDELRLPRGKERFAHLAPWCDSLARLLTSEIRDGIPLAAFTGCDGSREIREYTLATETALLAAAHACWEAWASVRQPGEPEIAPLKLVEDNTQPVFRSWLFALLESPSYRVIKQSLRHLDLGRTDFQLAMLYEARLANVRFENINLYRAYLQRADLKGANLQHANLQHANLQHANLQHANLRSANLQYANFIGADLQGTDLRGADLKGTNLNKAQYNGATQWPNGFDPGVAGAQRNQ